MAMVPKNKKNEEELVNLLEAMYDIPTLTVPNFLSLTLTPSN